MENGKYLVFEVKEDQTDCDESLEEIRCDMQLMDYCKCGFMTLKFIGEHEENS